MSWELTFLTALDGALAHDDLEQRRALADELGEREHGNLGRFLLGPHRSVEQGLGQVEVEWCDPGLMVSPARLLTELERAATEALASRWLSAAHGFHAAQSAARALRLRSIARSARQWCRGCLQREREGRWQRALEAVWHASEADVEQLELQTSRRHELALGKRLDHEGAVWILLEDGELEVCSDQARREAGWAVKPG